MGFKQSKLTKCEKGHFFDAHDFAECPYCRPDTDVRYYSFNEIRSQLEIYNGTVGQWREDYEHCHKCAYAYGKDDKWCKQCGTKREQILCEWFEPLDDYIGCVLMAPTFYVCRCSGCGFEWKESPVSINRTKYCPQCGSNQFTKELMAT